MTYRERRAARADLLRGWAEGREAKAADLRARNEPFRGDIAFNTQPGHIPERARVIARTERAWEHDKKAASMTSCAAEIDRQAAHAIYNDDPDAVEALAAKIARLTAQRDTIKAENAAHRKTHAVELAALTPYQRDHAMPHRGFETVNLTANIGRLRKRLEGLERKANR